LPAGLAAYYRLAHLFVTASRHEGYCLPLIEAMYRGVPVIARETGGTPEAMGNAGVLYGDLRPEELAELMALVLQDAPLRNEILASQKQRIETLMKRPMQEEFLSLLSPLVPTV
jgi:glycosyltransferase involved in cell wall biosynthesis